MIMAATPPNPVRRDGTMLVCLTRWIVLGNWKLVNRMGAGLYSRQLYFTIYDLNQLTTKISEFIIQIVLGDHL